MVHLKIATLVLVLLLSLSLETNAFGLNVPVSRISLSRRGDNAGASKLFLLPTQGNQLIAAGTSAYDDDDDRHHSSDEEHRSTSPNKRSMAAAARSLVHSAVSTLLPHSQAEKRQPDEVVFPLTGFALVRDKPDHYRVLSTTPNPSCRLPCHPRDSEVVFGWYSPACRLNSLVQDDTTYASHPSVKLTTSQSSAP